MKLGELERRLEDLHLIYSGTPELIYSRRYTRLKWTLVGEFVKILFFFKLGGREGEWVRGLQCGESNPHQQDGSSGN